MSFRGRVVAWAHRHQWAAGIGLAVSTLALLGIAVLIGWAIFAGSPPPAGDLGPSATPKRSSSVEPTEAATPTTPGLSPPTVPVAGWTPVEIAGVPWVAGIAERDGRLVAIGLEEIDGGAAVIAYSDDGAIWTPIDTASLGLGDGSLFYIAAGEPGFVAVGGRLAADYSPEGLYFFSADGREWYSADPPEHCAAGSGPRAVGSGFITFGQVCVSDGFPPPGPVRVVTSTDGRSWMSRLDAEMSFGPWTTDGERIVMLVGAGSEGRPDVAISDDGAGTWRHIPDAFPAGVTVYNVTWGHHRYVAEASWLNRPGNPDHAVCASDTGESWSCSVLSPVTAAPEEQRGIGALTPTSTGFASLLWALDDPFAPSGSTMILGTSPDGLDWTFATVPALKDALLDGIVGTSYGLYVWGSTYTGGDPSVPQEPYVLVHLAPMP